MKTDSGDGIMQTVVKIAICDDEAAFNEQMKSLCMEFFRSGKKPQTADIHTFTSGSRMLASGGDYDILFLDIEMPGQDGIGIKEYFETHHKTTRIIFMTSHKERVLEAFGKNVTGFLVKPVGTEAFCKVMEKTLSDICGQVLEFVENGETFIIPVRQIRYIEAQDKYTLAVTETGQCLMRRTMKFWEETLPEQDFCRIHKSYLINLDCFVKSGDGVLLDKGKKVKISRQKKTEVMRKYKEFLRRKVQGM